MVVVKFVQFPILLICIFNYLFIFLAPAFFHQKSKQVYVEKGGQAHLQCTALGDNPITIIWKFGPQRVGEEVDPRYFIYLFFK